MQLTESSSSSTGRALAGGSGLLAALAGATAALLAPVALAQGGATTAERTPWQVDSALLLYREGGGRVSAVEPVVSLRRSDAQERSWGLKLTFDALTGASPNGAAPQPGVQTFTSPSGNQTYSVAGGQTPLDPSFKDTRGALALSHERPIARLTRLSLGANASSEYDFTSLGASLGLAHDSEDRNTTWSAGLAFEADQLRPVGGTPPGLRPLTTTSQRGDNGSRRVTDLLLGVTQVMNRRWLMQFNLGLGSASGEHSDPYKILSVVDGSTGLVTGDGYVHEKRPDSRRRTSLYWGHKIHLKRDIVDLSYRFYRDDWGVRAHTLDARYRWMLGGGVYLEPRWRHYTQSAADFWRGWLGEGRDWSSSTSSTSLAAASADPRLAAFKADTFGLGIGWPLTATGTLTARLESYRQRQKQPSDAPGVLATLPVAPGLKATILTVGYAFDW